MTVELSLEHGNMARTNDDMDKYHARQMQRLGLPNRPVREDEQERNQGTSYNYNYSTYARHAYGLRACARLPCHRRRPAMVVSDELGRLP